MIETLFDRHGHTYYKATFPDGIETYSNCCWQADLLIQRWKDEKLAVNYRGANLSKVS